MEKHILTSLIEKNFSTWQIATELNTTQPNVRYWLKKYNLKTVRSLNKESLCKPRTCFYFSKKSGSYCKECLVQSNLSRQRKTKELAVDYKGGCCSICGYNKCIAALDFHHINPSEKDRRYFNMRGGLSVNLKTELDKCVLLCSNCHREIHNSS